MHVFDAFETVKNTNFEYLLYNSVNMILFKIITILFNLLKFIYCCYFNYTIIFNIIIFYIFFHKIKTSVNKMIYELEIIKINLGYIINEKMLTGEE